MQIPSPLRKKNKVKLWIQSLKDYFKISQFIFLCCSVSSLIGLQSHICFFLEFLVSLFFFYHNGHPTTNPSSSSIQNPTSISFSTKASIGFSMLCMFRSLIQASNPSVWSFIVFQMSQTRPREWVGMWHLSYMLWRKCDPKEWTLCDPNTNVYELQSPCWPVL